MLVTEGSGGSGFGACERGVLDDSNFVGVKFIKDDFRQLVYSHRDDAAFCGGLSELEIIAQRGRSETSLGSPRSVAHRSRNELSIGNGCTQDGSSVRP